MFNRVQPMFNPFEAAGTILSDLWPEMAIFSSFFGYWWAIFGKFDGHKVEHILIQPI